MKHLFTSTFKVFRGIPVKDKYNRPTKIELTEVGEYKGMFSRNRSEIRKSIVNSEAIISGTLFTEVGANIQVKDIIEIDGMTFIADLPYITNNHHLEVDLIANIEV